MHEGKIYITASGTCFGFLTPKDFVIVPYQEKSDNDAGKTCEECASDQHKASPKPSKELPLHLMVYDKLIAAGQMEGAVIHTHSTYSVLWSCVPGLDSGDCVPDHTPYLRMKMGSCGLISYYKPGSQELFEAFRKESGDHTGWLLSHHGLVTGGKNLMDAFGKSEELEESCKIAWALRGAGIEC